jgi:nicotinamidase-related amidase
VDQSTLVLQATGKKKLIVAGIVTDVCVSFVSLSALAEDFEVRPATSPYRFMSDSPRHHALNENELQCFITQRKSEGAQKVL